MIWTIVCVALSKDAHLFVLNGRGVECNDVNNVTVVDGKLKKYDAVKAISFVSQMKDSAVVLLEGLSQSKT